MEVTYRRLRTPAGTAICVSRKDPEQITIAVGARQRINCTTDEAHAIFRVLATTLFAGGNTAPKWSVRLPEVSGK